MKMSPEGRERNRRERMIQWGFYPDAFIALDADANGKREFRIAGSENRIGIMDLRRIIDCFDSLEIMIFGIDGDQMMERPLFIGRRDDDRLPIQIHHRPNGGAPQIWRFRNLQIAIDCMS